MIVCVRVHVFFAQQIEGENKEREAGLNPFSVDCHMSAPGLTLPLTSTEKDRAAAIKMLCKVRTSTETSFMVFGYAA